MTSSAEPQTMTLPQTEITISARAAALAWLNAFLAASTDDNRAVLFRSLSLEIFDSGVQFIGCDGTALFRSWVPSIAKDGAPWPGVDEEPDRSIVVMDPDRFGLGFMRALLRVTAEDGHEFEELSLTTAESDEEATLALGSDFMTQRLILRAFGQRIDLRLFDGSYPNWRALNLGIDPADRVKTLTIAPRMFALIGKLKNVRAVDLEFHGENKYVEFEAPGEVAVRGFVMPMRKEDDE